MKAICPNSPNHKRFSTVAHVMEDWEVDENGNFVAVIESLQTDHGPDPGNVWTCLECGAENEADVKFAKEQLLESLIERLDAGDF